MRGVTVVLCLANLDSPFLCKTYAKNTDPDGRGYHLPLLRLAEDVRGAEDKSFLSSRPKRLADFLKYKFQNSTISEEKQ